MFDVSTLDSLVADVKGAVSSLDALVQKHRSFVDGVEKFAEQAKAPKSRDEVLSVLSRGLDLLKTL